VMQRLQQIIRLRDQHMQQHQQLMAQEQEMAGGPRSPGPAPEGLVSTVRGNAQNIANVVEGEAQEVT